MKKYFLLLLIVACNANQKFEETVKKDIAPVIAPKKENLNLEKKVKFEDRINFAFDSSYLSEDSQKTLTNNIIWLEQNPNKDILIEGHCDVTGTKEYNLALGERRGYSVKKYLTDAGIKAKRIKVVSYGEEKPVALGTTEKAHQQNRRAEFIVK
jgi:peptidoglycan-associated lipoprotein